MRSHKKFGIEKEGNIYAQVKELHKEQKRDAGERMARSLKKVSKDELQKKKKLRKLR